MRPSSLYWRFLVRSRRRRIGSICVLYGSDVPSYVEVKKRGSIDCVSTIIYVYILLSIFLFFARHRGIVASVSILLTWLFCIRLRLILSGLFLILLYSVYFVIAAVTAKTFGDKDTSDKQCQDKENDNYDRDSHDGCRLYFLLCSTICHKLAN